MVVAPVSSAQQTGAARWREHSQESAAFGENTRHLLITVERKGGVNQSEGRAGRLSECVYVLTHDPAVTSEVTHDNAVAEV